MILFTIYLEEENIDEMLLLMLLRNTQNDVKTLTGLPNSFSVNNCNNI